MSAYGLASGELLAVDLAPGPAWVEIVHRCWSEGVPFLPLDVRLTMAERRALVDRALPAAALDATGELTLFAGAPVTDGVAVVVATSGTAGTPRLVELSRDAVVAAVRGSVGALGIDPTDPWVCCLTPAHVGGLLVLLRAEILGAPIAVLDGFDAVAIEAERARGAQVSLVPTMVRRLLRSDVAPSSRGGKLLVGGAQLDPELREEAHARGLDLVRTYGLTESSGGVVYDGVPFDGTHVRIGGDAQIELRGPTLMEGYRSDPAATGAAFDAQGWLRTGDAGALDPDGRLHVSGRLDEAIRTGAETVWPEEVERLLVSHPAIRDVAVVGRPHPEWGQEVVAFVVPASIDAPPQIHDVKAFLEGKLAGFKAPRALELVPRIPRTPAGKVRRADLPAFQG